MRGVPLLSTASVGAVGAIVLGVSGTKADLRVTLNHTFFLIQFTALRHLLQPGFL
jgi:hypothetical protein